MEGEGPQEAQAGQQQTETSVRQAEETWYAPLARVTPLSKYLAMVLFVALPFVGFWLGVGYGQSIYDSMYAPPVQVQRQEIQPVLETPQSPLSTLGTYRNETYGFEFQYPSGFFVDDSCVWSTGTTIGLGTEEHSVTCGTSHDSALITLVVSETQTTLDEHVANVEHRNLTNVQVSTTSLGAVPAILISGQLTEPEGGWVGPPSEGVTVVEVFAVRDGYQYTFSYSENEGDLVAVLSAIVASFRFFDPNEHEVAIVGVGTSVLDDSNSWLYTNSRYKFSLRVPNEIPPSLVTEDDASGKVKFSTDDNLDFPGPQLVFYIGTHTVQDFTESSFLEKGGGDSYWIKDRQYPDDPTTQMYLGENSTYVYYLSRGQDCYYGNNCTVYGNIDAIADTFSIADN